MTKEEKQKWEKFLNENINIKKLFGQIYHRYLQKIIYGVEDWPEVIIPEEKAIKIYEWHCPKFKIEIKEEGKNK